MNKECSNELHICLRLRFNSGLRMHWNWPIVSIMAALVVGCAGRTRHLPVTAGGAEIKPGEPGYAHTLQAQYLGSGGFLIRKGTNAVMTAPFYSNPGLLRVGLGLPITSDTNLVDRILPPVEDVAGILVGHSHYDHLMDVPFIAKHRAAGAKVYGSATTSNILSAECLSERLVDVEEGAGEFTAGGQIGRWHSVNGQVRIMALRSEHAPHIGCLKFFKGTVSQAQTNLPTTAYGWREGQTLAYLIDFLDADKRVEYRVFYHDSAVNCPKYGGLPLLPGSENRPPDLDILCMASFHNVAGYPEYVVQQHRPKYVVIAHWEDFFRSPLKEPKVVRMTNARKFLKRLTNSYPRERIILPKPGSWFAFARLQDQRDPGLQHILLLPPEPTFSGADN